MLPCLIDYSLYPVDTADVARIDPYLISSCIDRRDGQSVIKMYVGNKWYSYKLFALPNDSAASISGMAHLTI